MFSRFSLVPVAASVLMVTSLPAIAAERPDQFIRTSSRQVLEALKKEDMKAARADVEAIAIPKFDFRRMTALAIGRGWRQATIAQQNELQNEFKDLLVRTYSSTMFRFRNSQIDVAGNPRISPDGKEATVSSEVTTSEGKKARIDYTLYRHGNEWKIYNVSLEGASLVTVYRTNFNEIIQRRGVDGLIRSLKEKNASNAS